MEISFNSDSVHRTKPPACTVAKDPNFHSLLFQGWWEHLLSAEIIQATLHCLPYMLFLRVKVVSHGHTHAKMLVGLIRLQSCRRGNANPFKLIFFLATAWPFEKSIAVIYDFKILTKSPSQFTKAPTLVTNMLIAGTASGHLHEGWSRLQMD